MRLNQNPIETMPSNAQGDKLAYLMFSILLYSKLRVRPQGMAARIGWSTPCKLHCKSVLKPFGLTLIRDFPRN